MKKSSYKEYYIMNQNILNDINELNYDELSIEQEKTKQETEKTKQKKLEMIDYLIKSNGQDNNELILKLLDY